MSQPHSEPGAPKSKGFAGLSSLVGHAGAGDVAQRELPPEVKSSETQKVPAPGVPAPAAAESVIGSRVPRHEPGDPKPDPEQLKSQQVQQPSYTHTATPSPPSSTAPINEPGNAMLYVGIILVSVVAIFFANKSNTPPSKGYIAPPPSYGKAPEFPPLATEQINSQGSAIKELPASAAIDFNALNSPSGSAKTQSTDNLFENQPSKVAGQLLSPAELRYCVAQSFRIDGARSALDNSDALSVALFNMAVEDLNARCGDFQYRSGTLERAKEVMEPHRAKFEQEGKALLK